MEKDGLNRDTIYTPKYTAERVNKDKGQSSKYTTHKYKNSFFTTMHKNPFYNNEEKNNYVGQNKI